MPNPKSQTSEIRLADYTPPAFLVDRVDLDFDIQDKFTRVHTTMRLRRNPAAPKKSPLFLNGEAQKLEAVKLNGEQLTAKQYQLTEHGLTLASLPDQAVLEIMSSHDPYQNTTLSGLYGAGGMLSTQCEAEGFRRITYYPDRPDVLAKYTVTIHADRAKYPVLLSNGNLIAKGREGKTRHWVRWEDPFAKPCYLFALVAGKLDKVSSHFTTMSGRKVLLEIYTEPGKTKETGFAMDALKKSMAWDEATYGLEYDLDRFMIVAVSFFNMGAMENKGLNIFNDSCVLGRAETAPDSSIAFIERVVGHEYFHNYTGDRVTCRDWFQLSLKEGLTVFREQEFCGAQHGFDLERLITVASLRRAQFPEDAGAMAHPIRPAAYEAIDNFYTATVYNKGSEVCRMIQTMVGKAGFRKGLRLYLKRHDGQAATCENWVKAQEEANKIDMSQFMLWYSQAGTPTLDVTAKYDAKKQQYRLRVKQTVPPTPGQPVKKPMQMPLAVGLLDAKGKDLIKTQILMLTKADQEFVFDRIKAEPVPSLLRNFSAPVRLNFAYSDDQLLFLMAHDSDAFNRYEAGQKLFMKYALGTDALPTGMIAGLRNILRDKKIGAATKAMMLSLPSEDEIGLALKAQGKQINPLAIYERRQALIRQMAAALEDELWSVYETIDASLDERASDGVARGERSLKNLCLAYLAKVNARDTLPLAAELVASSRNMTDKIDGLNLLCDSDHPLKAKMLRWFERAYQGEANIMDDWLSAQSGARRPGVLTDVQRLM